MRNLHTTLLITILGSFLLSAPAAQAQECGDCNVDGEVDFLDGFAVSEHTLGTTPITGPKVQLCDTDGSGGINYIDRLIIDYGSITNCRTCLDCSGRNGRPDGQVDAWDYDAAEDYFYRGLGVIPPGSALQACDGNGDRLITTDDLVAIDNVVRLGAAAPPCSSCGDCDQDGDVDHDDSAAAANHDVGNITLEGVAFEACDVDDDSDVDIIDALKIKQSVGGPPLTSCTF